MTFRLEKEMYAVALEQLPAHLGLKQTYAYGTEIPLTYRIADIGFMPIGIAISESKEARSLCRLNHSVLWALSELIDWETSTRMTSHIQISEHITKQIQNKLIVYLCESGILRQGREGRIQPTEWLINQLGPIIFVELKLSRWQQALKQACFYLEKADMACVVLDGSTMTNVPIKPFEQEGIGLFAAWPTRIEMLVEPKPSSQGIASDKYFNKLRVVQDLSRSRSRKWTLSAASMELADASI